MSSTGRKSKSVRPLGAVRQPIQTPLERVGRIPAFNYNKAVHHDYELQGNAMQVPPPKEEKEKEKEEPKVPKTPIKSGKSDSGSSTKSQPQENTADKKELSDAKQIKFTYNFSLKPCSRCIYLKAKIKELKQKIAALEKEIEELKEQIKQRDRTIEDMAAEHKKMEEHFKKLYEAEVADHRTTQNTLEEANRKISDLQDELAKVVQEQEAKLALAQKEFDKKLEEAMAAKDKEIADRDAKLNRLKQQMAESLKGNSWERQQQLEELTKELGRIQDEADSLRIKLKQFKANKTCGNCQEMTSKLEKAVISLKEKDASLKELNGLCLKFETQLKKQDEILKMFADKKGHKMPK